MAASFPRTGAGTGAPSTVTAAPSTTAVAPSTRPVAVILVSLFLIVLGSNMQTTLLSVRAGIEGFRETSIGIFMAAFFLGYGGGSVLTVRFLRSVGIIRTFAALASIASAIALLHGLLVNPAAWALLRFGYGICYSGLVLIVESWLNREAPPGRRGRVLGIYGFVFLIGAGIAQFGLTIAPARGLVLFCVVSVFVSLSLVPTNLMRISEPRIAAYRRFPVPRIFTVSPFGAVGIVCAGLVGSVFWSMGPRFVQAIGMSESAVALFMAFGIGGAALLQWPLGRISDAVDRRFVILAAFAASAVASVFLIGGGRLAPPTVMMLAAVFGSFALPLYSLCLAHLNDHLAREDLLPAAATIVLLFGMASAAGPLLAGMVMSMIGASRMFTFPAGVAIIFVLYGLLRLPVRATIGRPAKRLYQFLPRTTHYAAHFVHRREGTPPGVSDGGAGPAGQREESSAAHTDAED